MKWLLVLLAFTFLAYSLDSEDPEAVTDSTEVSEQDAWWWNKKRGCTVGGSYKRSCRYCKKSGNTFKAQCRTIRGRWIWDSIALHGCNNVHNINGHLKRDNSCTYKCSKKHRVKKWRKCHKTCHKTCHKRCYKKCWKRCWKKCKYCASYKHKCTCTGCSSSGTGCTKCTGCSKYCAQHKMKNCNPYNCNPYNCKPYNCKPYKCKPYKCNPYNCNPYYKWITKVHTCRGGYMHADVATEEEVQQEMAMLAEMDAEASQDSQELETEE